MTVAMMLLLFLSFSFLLILFCLRIRYFYYGLIHPILFWWKDLYVNLFLIFLFLDRWGSFLFRWPICGIRRISLLLKAIFPKLYGGLIWLTRLARLVGLTRLTGLIGLIRELIGFWPLVFLLLFGPLSCLISRYLILFDLFYQFWHITLDYFHLFKVSFEPLEVVELEQAMLVLLFGKLIISFQQQSLYEELPISEQQIL